MLGTVWPLNVYEAAVVDKAVVDWVLRTAWLPSTLMPQSGSIHGIMWLSGFVHAKAKRWWESGCRRILKKASFKSSSGNQFTIGLALGISLQSLELSQYGVVIVVVQLLSRIRLFLTPCNATHQASLSFTIFQSLPKFMSIELVMLQYQSFQ